MKNLPPPTPEQEEMTRRYDEEVGRMTPPSTFHLVIPNADRGCLLAHRLGDVLSLPSVSPPSPIDCKTQSWITSWERHGSPLSEFVSANLGIDAYIVNALASYPDPAPRVNKTVLLVEPMNYDFQLPEGLQWLDRDTALTGDWERLHEVLNTRKVLTTYFAQSVDRSAPDHPAPWRRLGWFRDTEAWALSVLKHHGMDVLGQVHQQQNKFQSSILTWRVKEVCINRAHQDTWNAARGIFVKTTIPGIREAKKTMAISSVMERYTPKVLAIDDARNIMIQVGGYDIGDRDFAGLMAMLADMQISSIEHIEKLKAGGVPERGLSWLSSNFAQVLANPILELCEHEEHLRKLQGRVCEVQHACDRLAAYGIPDTLVHGDFHDNNICEGVLPGQDFSFIDWASCFIGHPLLDYQRVTSYGWYDQDFEKAGGHYFEKWGALVEEARMKEAIPLAFPLLLCYNLRTLLLFYEGMGQAERLEMLAHIEGALIEIGSALDEISEGSSTALVENGC